MNLPVQLIKHKSQSTAQVKQFIAVLGKAWSKTLDEDAPGYFEVHEGDVPLFTVTVVPNRRVHPVFKITRISPEEAKLVFAEVVEGGLPNKCLEEIEQSIYNFSFQRVKYYQRASGSSSVLFIETTKFTIYLMQAVENVEARR